MAIVVWMSVGSGAVVGAVDSLLGTGSSLRCVVMEEEVVSVDCVVIVSELRACIKGGGGDLLSRVDTSERTGLVNESNKHSPRSLAGSIVGIEIFSLLGLPGAATCDTPRGITGSAAMDCCDRRLPKAYA